MAKSVAKVPFKRIRERAAKRKGGEKVLASLLPKKPNNKALAKLPDDRVLSEMAARVFSAGFVWSVIDQKWPGFEEAFLEFNPKRLLFQPAEFWEKLASDKRIVRNPQKIRSVRDNARFVSEIAAEHGSFGKFLANWPADDQAGLLEVFAKRGSRLGGFSGQYLLRFLGWDAFVLSGDVLLCLRDVRRADQRHGNIEEGSQGGAGADQRLGQGKRPAGDARIAHLRAVDRREPRRGAAERGHAAMTDILLINPNTTASITELVLKTARRFASKGTSLRAVTGAFGPRYIASRVGYAIAGHAAVDAFANDRGRKDAVVLACFGDPGLAALKEIAKVPVVGMADASILQACAMGNRFSIVTGGERWKSMLEEFVASHGLASRLASVRTVAPTGADIARNPKAAMALLAKGCSACVREDGADVVILGGAGLAGLAAKLKTMVDAPLLDGVACAISMAEGLARQKPVKAASGALALPAPVDSVGLSPALAKLLGST